MQQDINEKQPKLKEHVASTEHLTRELQIKAETEVEPKKRQIAQEEENANAVAMKAQEIKIDCENNLDKAMPILKSAQEALNTIKSAHINEIKVLHTHVITKGNESSVDYSKIDNLRQQSSHTV